GAALVDGIRRLGDDDDVLAGRRVEDDLREGEDRLLRTERRHDVVRRDRGAEAASDPTRDGLPELGETGAGGIAHPLPDAVAERLDEARVRRLARIAHTEVDHLQTSAPPRRCGLVEADERIRRLRAQDGGDGHRYTPAEATKRCSVS